MLSSLDTDKTKTPTVPDRFEPINIEGQDGTGIWIHQPGSEVSQFWQPRKGKARKSMETMVQSVPNSSFGSAKSTASGNSYSSSDDENPQKNSVNRVRRSLRKISSVFQRSPRGDQSGSLAGEAVQSPYANIKSADQRAVGVKFVVEDNLAGVPSGKVSGGPSSPGSDSDSPRRNVKNMAKSIFKHAERSAHGLKHVLTRKGSKNAKAEASGPQNSDEESESSDDESISSPKVERVSVDPNPIQLSSPKMEMISEASNLRSTSLGAVNSDNAVEHAVETSSNKQIHQAHEGELTSGETIVGSPEKEGNNGSSSPKGN